MEHPELYIKKSINLISSKWLLIFINYIRWTKLIYYQNSRGIQKT